MNALFDMGGYELYVWGSVALALAVFVWNLLAPAVQRRAVIAQLAESDADESAGESS